MLVFSIILSHYSLDYKNSLRQSDGIHDRTMTPFVNQLHTAKLT